MIKRVRQLFVLILALVLNHSTTGATEVSPPRPFKATYVLTSGPLTLGQMTRKLHINDDGNFVYDSHSKPIGYAKWFVSTVLKERSVWAMHEGRPRPLSYRYDRTGDKDRERHVHIRFDWEKMRVINTINNDPWIMEIPPGTLDKLLYHLAVSYDLQQGRETLTYEVADGGKIKHYEFQRLGRERIETPLGDFITIKLKKTSGKRHTVIWCAPELDYLPVQIEQQEKRGDLTMQLIAIEGIERHP